MLSRLTRLARRCLEAGPEVTLYRARQALSLLLWRRLGLWERLDRRIDAAWDNARAGAFMERVRSGSLPVGPDSLAAFSRFCDRNPGIAQSIVDCARDVLAGRQVLFGQPFDLPWGKLPYNEDWRFGHRFEPMPFEGYVFFTRAKAAPFDVKYPWEVSRLAFLYPLIQAAAVTGQASWLDQAASAVADWDRFSPLARSVGWYPMECAMRGLALAHAACMAACLPMATPAHVLPLLAALNRNAAFLYRTVEYTDVRGNHYAANLAALVWMGRCLDGLAREARAWTDFAAPRVEPEIGLQFLADGVDMEKATAYHRLVAELFLLAAIALEGTPRAVGPAGRERLRLALAYDRDATRPDGLSPVIGDNDSATALPFEPRAPRDHGALAALGAAFVGDAALLPPTAAPSAAVPWLLGQPGQAFAETARPLAETAFCRHYPQGGMFAVRDGGNFLLADYGEVGQFGRGGHGHNDTFSFELCLDGDPVVIDPGVSTYSGDMDRNTRYRQSASHNTLVADGLEMAEIKGPWRIGNEAAPRNVSVSRQGDAHVIEAEHHGYTRLPDPVVHRRRLVFDAASGVLACRDSLEAAGEHSVALYFHFDPGLTASLSETGLGLTLPGGGTAAMTWTPGATARLESALVSPEYGQETQGPCLVLTYAAHGAFAATTHLALTKKGRRA